MMKFLERSSWTSAPEDGGTTVHQDMGTVGLHLMTQHHIPKDLSVLKHHCENSNVGAINVG
jgi:hypothetical protein